MFASTEKRFNRHEIIAYKSVLNLGQTLCTWSIQHSWVNLVTGLLLGLTALNQVRHHASENPFRFNSDQVKLNHFNLRNIASPASHLQAIF